MISAFCYLLIFGLAHCPIWARSRRLLSSSAGALTIPSARLQAGCWKVQCPARVLLAELLPHRSWLGPWLLMGTGMGGHLPCTQQSVSCSSLSWIWGNSLKNGWKISKVVLFMESCTKALLDEVVNVELRWRCESPGRGSCAYAAYYKKTALTCVVAVAFGD